MSGIPLRSLLDPRSKEQAEDHPFLDSVSIPFQDLPRQVYALPSKDTIISVADVGEVAGETARWLESQSRNSVLSKPKFGRESTPGRLWSPNPFLETWVMQKRPGLAADLGCGAGREAVFLASLGWHVLGFDKLPDALERAQLLSSMHATNPRIEWNAANLEQEELDLPELDLAVMCFFLDRDCVRRTLQRLRPGGAFVLETFSAQHRETFGKPKSSELSLSPEEVSELFQGFSLEHVSFEWRESGRHTARVVAVR